MQLSGSDSQRIIENLRDGYFELDLKGRFTAVNRSLCEIYGYSEEEMIGADTKQFAVEETPRQSIEAFNKIYQTSRPGVVFDFQVVRKDGARRHLEVSASLMKDADGNPVGFRGISRDVTERKEMESLLRQSEERYRSIIEEMEDGYFEVDFTGTFTFVNPAQCRQLGYSYEELIGMGFQQYTDEENGRILYDMFVQVYETGQAITAHDLEVIRKDGSRACHEISGYLMYDAEGRPSGFRGIARDVTERKEMEALLRQSEERYRSIISEMEDGYFEVDLEGRFTFVNAAECQNLGYTYDELIGMSFQQCMDEENGRILYDMFVEVYETGQPIRAYDLEIIRKDGTVVVNQISGSLIKDARDKPAGFRGIARDVTERKRAEERIRHMATHDALTGLPNRMMFVQLLNQSVKSAQRYKREFALLFLDLDGFKTVNDTLGHAAGDQLLQEMAERLKNLLRASDVIARMGGDEFVVLIEAVDAQAHVATVARKIVSAISQPMPLFGEDCRVTASLGISMFPKDGKEGPQLMKKADMAMYRAKEEGKNNYQFYCKNIRSKSLDQVSIQTQLPHALERGELYLAYQARLDFKTGRINGVEALLRWSNPHLGEIPPSQLIPVAEDTGLIIPIGRWVLKTVCRQNAAWQQQGLPFVCVSVNLSLQHLTCKQLNADIEAALEAAGLAPEYLEIEIAEQMLMHEPAVIVPIINQIKAMGVRVAIDDFGTGYSTLAQLARFPVDTLKMDRSFIRNIMKCREDKTMAEALIAMGKSLSLTVVAEGVETLEQSTYLREQTCDGMQGFYLSKPVGADDFASLLKRHDASAYR